MSVVRQVFWKELTLYVWPAGRPSKQAMMQWLPGFALMIPLAFVLGSSGSSDLQGVRPTTFIPFLLLLFAVVGPANLASDSFAGERERHTLETVLAGPVTPRQLLWGKVLAQLALMGIGAAIALVVGTIVLMVIRPTPVEVTVFFVALPFVVGGSLVMGLMMLLMSNLASIQSPNVKATSSRMMSYFLVAFVVGFVPMAFLAPLLGGVLSMGEPDIMLALLFIGLPVLGALAFLGYLGFLFYRLMLHTRPDRFKIEV